MNVAELERALLARFPAADAEPWDRVGLSVGDPAAEVRRVAVALDATATEVRAAAAAGATVLVAHHPMFLDAPDAVAPAGPAHAAAGAAVWEAARSGVAVISLHTNLDRSLAAREALPALLGARAVSSLEFPDDPARRGLGAVADGLDLTLAELARRCGAAFGGAPRVWGPPALRVSRLAVLGGSLGSSSGLVPAAGADAVVTGELGYHAAQDLCLRGIGAVLLGHDRSERPFTAVLAAALAAAGVPEDAVVPVDPAIPWWTAAEGDRS